MGRVKIVADANIPFVQEAFADVGEVVCVAGRAITSVTVRDADVLLVRSVTKVNGELLAGSSVKFVATATIGVDHVDTHYLKDNRIGFASAPGSNANSVAEYVGSAIAHLANEREMKTDGLLLGIIGVGNVGSRVKRVGEALGMECLMNDPPKKRLTGNAEFLPLERVVAECDVVTVHVPLSMSGADRTYRLIDRQILARMREGAILMNTSRGGVVDEEQLRAGRGRLGGVVLDVWENEPAISVETLAVTDIATPHIAGYSYDGKLQGSQMVYDAVCAHFHIDPVWSVEPHLQAAVAPTLELDSSSDPVFHAVSKAYPILADDQGMRAMAALPESQRASRFDAMRKEYPRRLEFRHHPIKYTGADPVVARRLHALGFVASKA